MSARNASRLQAGLIARKGEASPAAPVGQGIAPAGEAGRPRGVQGTIAVTVRLDPARYERMKVHGARSRMTNQDILVAALDRFFGQITD